MGKPVLHLSICHMCDKTFPMSEGGIPPSDLDKTMRTCDICHKNVHADRCGNIVLVVPEVYLCFQCIKNKSDKI